MSVPIPPIKPEPEIRVKSAPPVNYWLWTIFGCFLGTIGGPVLLLAGVFLLAWVYPNGGSGGPGFWIAAFVLSVPIGAIAGGIGMNYLVSRFDRR